MQQLISLFGGALLGYLFARLQRREESRERRALLLEVLRNELHYLDPHLGPFRIGVAFHRHELVLLAPARLLDVLDYGGDSALIRALLEFQAAVDRHNGLIRSVNLARCMGATAEAERHVMQQELVQQHAAILTAAERVRRLLPVPQRGARQPSPLRRLLRRLREGRSAARGRLARGPAPARAATTEPV